MTNSQLLKGYAWQARRKFQRVRRIIRNPELEFAGRRHLVELRRQSQSQLRMDPRKGWVRFDARRFSSANCTMELARTLGEKWAAGNDPERHINRGFPINMMFPSDLLEHSEILEFALCDEFLLTASEYLGQIPRLFNLWLWWSPPSESLDGSRQYHYDHRDSLQVKIFLNLTAVGEQNGPLHFLPADSSALFNARLGYPQGKIPDDLVYSVCSREDVFDNCGEAGTGVMVDTSRCLHYGSRKNSLDRLLLMISYARPNCIRPNKCATLDPVREELAKKLYSRDPIRYYALTVPVAN